VLRPDMYPTGSPLRLRPPSSLPSFSLKRFAIFPRSPVLLPLTSMSCDYHRVGCTDTRESKLTRLLQDSLGGNARTLLIATLSPSMCVRAQLIPPLQPCARIVPPLGGNPLSTRYPVLWWRLPLLTICERTMTSLESRLT